jgi:Putative zinc- or iron-chelating domain
VLRGETDATLLAGFRFSCRPDCGLCCFATPAVSRPERVPLLASMPDLRLIEGRAGVAFIPSRPNGGACQLLDQRRCRSHAARPFPCRSYPVTVSIGPRVQAALVLSCPGVGLEGLDRFPPLAGAPDPVGLTDELEAVTQELERPAGRSRIELGRTGFRRSVRRLEREGRWIDVDRSSGALVEHVGPVVRETLSPTPPPSLADGVESLPLHFDATFGPVALSEEAIGWGVVGLSETGAPPTPLGRFPVPTTPPVTEPAAADLLARYLAYALARDSFLGQAIVRLTDDPTLELEPTLGSMLVEVASDVLARSVVLEQLHGRPGDRLDRSAVEQGIRATDADVLDRPSATTAL